MQIGYYQDGPNTLDIQYHSTYEYRLLYCAVT